MNAKRGMRLIRKGMVFEQTCEKSQKLLYMFKGAVITHMATMKHINENKDHILESITLYFDTGSDLTILATPGSFRGFEYYVGTKQTTFVDIYLPLRPYIHGQECETRPHFATELTIITNYSEFMETISGKFCVSSIMLFSYEGKQIVLEAEDEIGTKSSLTLYIDTKENKDLQGLRLNRHGKIQYIPLGIKQTISKMDACNLALMHYPLITHPSSPLAICR